MRGLLNRTWAYGGRCNLRDKRIPVLRSAEVGSIADDVIVLTYNERLDTTSTPAAVDFIVYGTTETIDSIVVSDRTVSITMTGVISELETIFIDYIADADPIRDRAENNAADLNKQYIANHCTTYYRDQDGNLIMGIELIPIPIGKRIDITDGGGAPPVYTP